MGQIFRQALEHVPALLFIWVTIYAIYWLLGMVNWPRFAKRDELLDRWGTVSLDALGGFSWKSLALISLLSLFLELLLIRWITSEIRVFAYFKSLVLIACFLGFGIGCYLTRRKIRVAYMLLPLLGMVLLIELPWDSSRRLITNLSAFIGWFSDVHIWSRAYFAGSSLWGAASAGVAISIVIPIFGLIAISFVPMGQLVGWYLENSSKGVRAYSVNVLASIAGIWLFTILCFYSTPPILWFVILGIGLLIYFWKLRPVRKTLLVTFALVIVLFGIGRYRTEWWGEQSWKGSITGVHQLYSGQPQTYWSPYQKLTVVPLIQDGEVVRYILNTNDSWYQQILDLSATAVAKNPHLYRTDEDEPISYHQYNIPYRFYQTPPQKVLIAGAGMGNDVAAALRNGAGSVVAVEIDPLIYAKGKDLHFERPYLSDRVAVHVDDARSFVQNCREQFDLIVFSILDSHTTSSSYTNIRLDNYVYTVEAMRATRKLLKPDGLFVMSFSGERPWFAKRLQDVITAGFGKEPLLVQPNYSFFVVSPGGRVEEALKADPELKQFTSSHTGRQKLEPAALLTDDWPYLYQQYRGIPVIVWVLSLGLIGVCWLTLKRLNKSAGGVQWHFFFLGAAFMLLEVQVISKTALLFGTTWLVNAIVITGLLLFILLSNVVVSVVPRFPRQLAYAGLFVTLALNYLIPSQLLFHESLLIRGALTTLLYCSPVFFAGLIFISSFKQIGFRAEAFGSNLLGALVGGLLDSLSYLVGIKALVLISAALYLMSLLAIRLKSKERVVIGAAATPTS